MTTSNLKQFLTVQGDEEIHRLALLLLKKRLSSKNHRLIYTKLRTVDNPYLESQLLIKLVHQLSPEDENLRTEITQYLSDSDAFAEEQIKYNILLLITSGQDAPEQISLWLAQNKVTWATLLAINPPSEIVFNELFNKNADTITFIALQSIIKHYQLRKEQIDFIVQNFIIQEPLLQQKISIATLMEPYLDFENLKLLMDTLPKQYDILPFVEKIIHNRDELKEIVLAYQVLDKLSIYNRNGEKQLKIRDLQKILYQKILKTDLYQNYLKKHSMNFLNLIEQDNQGQYTIFYKFMKDYKKQRGSDNTVDVLA